MPSLLELLKSKAHWVVFVLLEVASLTLLFKYNPYQQSLWFDLSTEVSGAVDEQRHQIDYYAQLREENRQLTRENVTLQQSLEVLRDEVRELRHEPDYTERQLSEKLKGFPLIPAQVCENSVRRADNILLINRGRSDGVRREQGVVCGTGVVGIVAGVSEHYATVIPILNSKSSISCRLRGTQFFGYLHWSGGNPLVATLDDVPHHAPVRLGDAVETSGFSKIFPEGIFVGKVTRIRDSADGQALQLSVQLSVDLSKLNEVLVVVNEDAEDIQEAKEAEL
ncbi:MAG: rod shape-determining protein MreC [Prevotellaceae bacterium]|nr:rod shape-determining protein MreC [Prevotellaceae bacterium]